MFAAMEYSATFVLASFVAVFVIVGLLYQSGLLGVLLRFVFGLAERCIRGWSIFPPRNCWES